MESVVNTGSLESDYAGKVNWKGKLCLFMCQLRMNCLIMFPCDGKGFSVSVQVLVQTICGYN